MSTARRTPPDSVLFLMRQLNSGEVDAVGRLWERYSQRLNQFAKKLLLGVPCGAGDWNDVAQRAFEDFYFGAIAGRFDKVTESGLWRGFWHASPAARRPTTV